LDKVVVVGKVVIRKLWRSLSEISKELFGVGFGWKLFQKHRGLILERIKGSRKLGLSSGDGEDKNVLSSEAAAPGNAETEKEPKKHLTELSTARCVTATNNAVLSASTPPFERAATSAGDEAELAMGTAVFFQQSGSCVEAVKTRVTGKTTQPDGTVLYRLEKGAEGQPLMVSRACLTVVNESATQDNVIRATAAQLLQVLGKACPFVGPGLWTVTRNEVPAKAWGQLCRLVGAM
ncbi:MAG: hypothetical protein AAFP03_19465, partial [Cyanobacteria bacterium J06598_3]